MSTRHSSFLERFEAKNWSRKRKRLFRAAIQMQSKQLMSAQLISYVSTNAQPRDIRQASVELHLHARYATVLVLKAPHQPASWGRISSRSGIKKLPGTCVEKATKPTEAGEVRTAISMTQVAHQTQVNLVCYLLAMISPTPETLMTRGPA